MKYRTFNNYCLSVQIHTAAFRLMNLHTDDTRVRPTDSKWSNNLAAQQIIMRVFIGMQVLQAMTNWEIIWRWS